MSKALSLVLVLLIIAGCGQKPEPALSASEQLALAQDYYNKRKFIKAQAEFEKLIYTYPGLSLVDTAQFYLAMTYYQQKEFSLAVGEFKRLLQSYPKSEFADDAQFYIGLCHYRMSPKYSLDQTDTYLAQEAFNTLISEYPGSPFVPEAKAKLNELADKLAQKGFMTGLLYLKLGDADPALLYFWHVRDNYPASEWAIRAFYYTGEAQLELKQYDEANQTFENFLRVFPNHKLAEKARRQVAKLNQKNSGVRG